MGGPGTDPGEGAARPGGPGCRAEGRARTSHRGEAVAAGRAAASTEKGFGRAWTGTWPQDLTFILKYMYFKIANKTRTQMHDFPSVARGKHQLTSLCADLAPGKLPESVTIDLLIVLH